MIRLLNLNPIWFCSCHFDAWLIEENDSHTWFMLAISISTTCTLIIQTSNVTPYDEFRFEYTDSIRFRSSIRCYVYFVIKCSRFTKCAALTEFDIAYMFQMVDVHMKLRYTDFSIWSKMGQCIWAPWIQNKVEWWNLHINIE